MPKANQSKNIKKKKSLPLVCAFLFFFSFAVYYALNVPFPSPSHPIQFYSTHSRDDLKLITMKALKKATHSISLHTYSLTDPSILTILKNQAKKGIKTDLFYHAKATPKIHSLEDKNLHFHPTQAKGLKHEKIFIIDNNLTFFGTANLTPSSLMMHENFLLSVYSKEICSYTKKRENVKHYFKQTEQTLDLRFLPDQGGETLNALLKTLDGAQKSVHIALFTLTHPLIVEKLLELAKREVKIFISIDGYTARGASSKALKRLESTNYIEISITQGPQLFHHKWALIDDHTFILGSANWTKAAFEKNQEFLLFLTPLTKHQINYFNKIVKIIKK